MLVVVLAGVGIGVYLFRNFQSRTDKAASTSYVTCIAPSSCMAAGSCYRQGGTTNGSCSASGDVCCSLPVPAKAYPDFSTQGAATSVVADNCCNRSDYKSCAGANQQETAKNFTEGYYACQTAKCGACKYKSESVSLVDGIKTSFYSDTTQAKLFAVQLSSQLNFSPGSGAPLVGMPTDNFSIVAEGFLTTTKSDDYFIQVEADNTVRVWVDDKLIIDRFGSSSVAKVTGEAYLQTGVNHRIKVLYAHATGTSKLVLTYAPAYSSSATYIPLSLKVNDSQASLLSSIVQGNFASITAGESISGTRSIAFTADPSTTSSVVFQLVGKNISFTDYSSPYNFGEGGSYNFSSLPTGSYTLEAEAHSNIMKGSYKKSITFNVTSTSPSPTPQPKTANAPVIADTYVDKNNATRNYGTANALGVDGSPVKISYLKFDLAPYKGMTLTKATLNLHVKDVTDAGSTGTQNIKTTNSSWSETSINYNTRPTLGTGIGSFVKPVRNTWIKADITNSVKSSLGTNYSIAIDSTSSDGLDLDSRESTSKPYITLEFASGVLGVSDTNDLFTDINDGDEVSGILYTGYQTDISVASQVEYFIDESRISVENMAPFIINHGQGFDVTNITEGEHVLKVVVYGEESQALYEDSIKFIVKKQDAKGGNFLDYLKGLFSK